MNALTMLRREMQERGFKPYVVKQAMEDFNNSPRIEELRRELTPEEEADYRVKLVASRHLEHDDVWGGSLRT